MKEIRQIARITETGLIKGTGCSVTALANRVKYHHGEGYTIMRAKITRAGTRGYKMEVIAEKEIKEER